MIFPLDRQESSRLNSDRRETPKGRPRPKKLCATMRSRKRPSTRTANASKRCAWRAKPLQASDPGRVTRMTAGRSSDGTRPSEMRCDVAVIGAGTGGLAAERAARQAGAKTLLIDDRLAGTTCTTVGCMPSKLLIAAANAAKSVRKAATFGIGALEPAIDGHAVMGGSIGNVIPGIVIDGSGPNT